MTTVSNDGQSVSPDVDQAGLAESQQHIDFIRQKVAALQAQGFGEGQAHEMAFMESRIAQWPATWNDDLMILIYGDFAPPTEEWHFPSLGITILPEEVKGSLIKSAMCVLQARVKIREKSIAALTEAASRINILLGIVAGLNWGNFASGWYSHVTHGTIAGIVPKVDPDRVQKVVGVLKDLPLDVGRKVRAALYWIREPRQLLMEGYRIDALREYAGYWNAFECLVEAVCLVKPQHKLTPTEKKAAIDKFVAAHGGNLNQVTIAECYKEFVDPGFVAKASHSLKICFPDRADKYIDECFRMKPKEDRLYHIRNAINHGDIDADNIIELLRVEGRHRRLWMIVFGMLGSFLPFDRPLDES